MAHQSRSSAPPPNVSVNGAAIRARRIELGHNLGQFAPRVGINVQYLSQIELGRRPRVSPRVFRALVEALDMEGRVAELKVAA